MSDPSLPGPHPNELPAQTDVVIIGMGIVGAMVAYRLTERGVACVAFDADGPGNGSTGRSAACIRQQFGTPGNIRFSMFGVQLYREFHALFDFDFPVMIQNGYLFLYDRAERFEAALGYLKVQHECGLAEAHALSPEELRRTFPHIDASGLVGATFCATDGYMWPYEICMAALHKAKEHGLATFANTPVTGIGLDERGRVAHVESARGRVRCRTIVNATGAWSALIAKWVGTSLPVEPIKRYLYTTHEFEALDASGDLIKRPMTVVPNGAYLRPERPGFLLGWAHPTPPDWTFNNDVEVGYGRRDDEYGVKVLAALAEFIPELWDTGIARASCGFYEVTPDHNSIIDRDPHADGLYHVTGFSGHGIMHAPAAGLAIAEWILDGAPHSIDTSEFRLDRDFGHVEGMVI